MPEIIFLMGKSATGKDHIYEQLVYDKADAGGRSGGR